MALTVLRHTVPTGAVGLCYGRLDLDVVDGFADEAARIAGALPPITAIVSSPLQRARKLADMIGAARGLPVRADARLTEIDFGAWEGVPWDDVPRDQIDAWAADVLGARPHGGESVAMLAKRVAEALEGLADGTLIVAHAGVARAALAWAGAPDPWEARLAYGEWLTVSRP